jgi:hypothetical protein
MNLVNGIPIVRFSSHWIVAQQDSGKTYLLMSMICRDLQRDCSLVVMDSKGQLTQWLRSLALGDRLIVLDPAEPFAINPFDVPDPGEAISHLSYMLSGLLETNVSSKQRTFFETLLQGLLQFPETPTLRTVWDVTTHGPERFRHQINQLSPNLQNFFWKEWASYTSTREEVQWRLRGLFNKTHLANMFSAPKTRFDIGSEMQKGKVIVIDNSQAKCTKEGCGFLGRFFVSQIWWAGTLRHLLPDSEKKPTFVYIDEAVTSGLNFTQNHRFEFAVAAAAGAVD